MRVACGSGAPGRSLNDDLGITVTGSVRDVNYTVTMGAIEASVDWGDARGNGATLTSAEIDASGVLALAAAVADAAGVWFNLTKDKACYDIAGGGDEAAAMPSPRRANAVARTERARRTLGARGNAPTCPTCPPCDDCPPCPVSYCDWEDDAPCDFQGALPKTFSWEGIGCNEALSQIDIKGVGRDIYWPPQVAHRNYTVESIVGPRHLGEQGCAAQYSAEGLRGAPLVSDAWSGWMTAYYGGRNVSHHRNIVWSNGALDPWSGQGVYPPTGGGPDGPMVQNISADGSQIALLLDLGAHHLDLMFSDSRNPPCFFEARKIETRMMRQWCQEAYDAHS
jgi:hypothetical protein